MENHHSFLWNIDDTAESKSEASFESGIGYLYLRIFIKYLPEIMTLSYCLSEDLS